jgi:hypothetical protein
MNKNSRVIFTTVLSKAFDKKRIYATPFPPGQEAEAFKLYQSLCRQQRQYGTSVDWVSLQSDFWYLDDPGPKPWEHSCAECAA